EADARRHGEDEGGDPDEPADQRRGPVGGLPKPCRHDGMTSATRSAATPIHRKSHPAASLDPSERANHPFMAMPTAAKVTAAARNRIVKILRAGDAWSLATLRTVTVTGGVTGRSANPESADEKPSGTTDSVDGVSSSRAAGLPFCRLRCRYPRERSALVLAFLG